MVFHSEFRCHHGGHKRKTDSCISGKTKKGTIQEAARIILSKFYMGEYLESSPTVEGGYL